MRLQLRLDRVKSPIWTAAVVLLVVVSAVSIDGLYPDQASIDGYARLVQDNAAVIVQAGPGYGLAHNPTRGTVLMNELSMWTIVLVGLMSIMLVTRHTRAEEESERAELLRSGPVGRHAAALATIVNVALVNLIVAVGVLVGLVATGYAATGSVAFALALWTSGLLFAGIALVSSQVASTGRAATGMGLVVLAVSFLLRAVGDVTGSALSWLSPIGIGQAVRAFADERWWTPIVSVLLAAGFTWLASVLASRRDFGAGMLPERAGRAEASGWLRGPVTLAARLQRGAWLGWIGGVVFLGAFYGALANEAEQMVADNPDLEAFFAQSAGATITQDFLASAGMVLALLLAGYAISGVLRLAGEENHDRVESLLATPTSRSQWATSHLLVTASGLVVVAVAAGLAVGAGAAVTTGEARHVTRMLGAMLAFMPAVALLASAAFVLWAWLPRLALLAWLGLVWSIVAGLFAELLDLPGWALDLSPVAHVPAMPAEAFDVVPLIVMAALTIALVAFGMAGFARRDVSAT